MTPEREAAADELLRRSIEAGRLSPEPSLESLARIAAVVRPALRNGKPVSEKNAPRRATPGRSRFHGHPGAANTGPLSNGSSDSDRHPASPG